MPVTQFEVTEKYEYTHGFAVYSECVFHPFLPAYI